MSSRASARSKRGALSADSHGCRTATRPSTTRSRWNQACHASIAGSTSSRKSRFGSASCRARTAVASTGGCVMPLVGMAGAPSHSRDSQSSGPGAVLDGLRMKDDVRHHPVGPLPLEQRAHLDAAALGVDRREPDRDEGRVPVPLERVEPLRRLDEAAGVVRPQDGDGTLSQRRPIHRHSVASAGATSVVVRTYLAASSGSTAWRRRGGSPRTMASRSSTTRAPISQSAS